MVAACVHRHLAAETCFVNKGKQILSDVAQFADTLLPPVNYFKSFSSHKINSIQIESD